MWYATREYLYVIRTSIRMDSSEFWTKNKGEDRIPNFPVKLN